MKRLLALALFAFTTINVNAQEISEDQWILIQKKTADWCSLCGSWGWNFKNDLLEDFEGENVVFWMVHFSSNNDLDTPTAKAISNNFGSAPQPSFFIENDNQNVTSGTAAEKRDLINIFVETFSGNPPQAGVGSVAVFDGEKITTTSRVKFLQELAGGDYWLASYLVDDELISFQAAQSSSAVHENILMHSFHGTNYFGENVITGAVAANEEFTIDGELDFSGQTNIPDYSDGYSIVTVLWARVAGEYTPVNLNRQPITAIVSTNDVLSNVDISAFHLGAGQVNLNITSDEKINNANISLFNINGQTVASQQHVQINSGENQILLEGQDLTIGTYVVVVESAIGSRSIKISVR
ncbi:MAG: T9SS type A sorting domain-containing protein [Bacteroidota bacterium]